MSEVEAATIAFQEATIAYQNASLAYQEATIAIHKASLTIQETGLAIQQDNLTLGYWQTALSALTLVVSSGLVMYGFRLIRLGTEQRREEARQQHTETMRALEALIERTAPQS